MLHAAVAVGVIVVLAGPARAADYYELQLWVDPDGTAYLHNTTGRNVSFDAYQIMSETKNLDPVAWDSIADRIHSGRTAELQAALGAGALHFGEAGPTELQLGELNLANVGTLAPAANFSLGKPFKDLQTAISTDRFYWYPPGGDGLRGIIVPTPEPSTRLLATLAGLGLPAMRRRR